ncbi:helix-turn-helix domain-containing protein, partial [Oleiphilus sp. HI0079]
LKVGYADTSNFSRVFRRWFNQTPSEFRSTHE